MTLAWRNHEHIRRWFLNDNAIGADQHRSWWRQYSERDDDFVFVIEETRSLCRPVGQVSIYRVDWNARTAEFGRLMIGDPDASGQGLAKEATALIITEAAKVWGINQLALEVRTDNLPAIAIYRHLGFEDVSTREGVIVMRWVGSDLRQSYGSNE